MSNQITTNTNKQKLVVYIFLPLVTLAVYWFVNKFDFINFDDNLYVSQNSIIQSGLTLRGFIWSFSTTYAEFWHPMTWLSLMLDYQLYGLNAGGYHITNLILHILSTLLLFWLFARMTRQIWPSAFVAAFFALHPLHVESVAWVSERKDVLSAFFWMLTLCLYVYYTEKPVIKRYLLVLFSFVLALMSKPMVVTLPLIMILLDYWPLRRFQSQKSNLFLWQFKEKWPLFTFSAVFSIITLFSKQIIYEKDTYFSFIDRLAYAPVAFVTYLIKTFWPHDMAIFYPFPVSISACQIVGALLPIIFISITAILLAKRSPYLLFGWLWYMTTIAPVIGIIQIGDFAMADRFYYLPSIGIGVMLAWGITSLFPSKNIHKNVLFSTAIAALMFIAVLAWQQCIYWKNSVTLFSHALQATRNNYMAHNNLGSALLEKGEIKKALYHYDKAISIKDYAAAYYNRGVIYYRLGQNQQAIRNFHEAIRLKPDYAEAFYNLGMLYHLFNQQQIALKHYNEAIRIMPNHANAYNNRAFIYLNIGNNISGCNNAQKACALGNCRTLIWAKRTGLCN